MTINFHGTKFDIDAQFTPGQTGGMDDPSWPDYWEVHRIWATGSEHTNETSLVDFMVDYCPHVLTEIEEMLLTEGKEDEGQFLFDRLENDR